jgi:hypothetical protein
MTEADVRPTVANPSGATAPDWDACTRVRERLHAIVCDLSDVSAVAEGLVDLLEDVLVTRGSFEPGEAARLSVVIRLARAQQCDVSKDYRALDRLCLDELPTRGTESALAEARA